MQRHAHAMTDDSTLTIALQAKSNCIYIYICIILYVEEKEKLEPHIIGVDCFYPLGHLLIMIIPCSKHRPPVNPLTTSPPVNPLTTSPPVNSLTTRPQVYSHAPITRLPQ